MQKYSSCYIFHNSTNLIYICKYKYNLHNHKMLTALLSEIYITNKHINNGINPAFVYLIRHY